jgi:F-type H+-transporting ATPase subunit epsilon
MRITVISPAKAVYDGEANAVTAPAYDGLVGILPRHAPFLTLLGDGPLTVRTPEGVRTFRVRGGILQVLHDTIRVVTEHAEATDAKGE